MRSNIITIRVIPREKPVIKPKIDLRMIAGITTLAIAGYVLFKKH